MQKLIKYLTNLSYSNNYQAFKHGVEGLTKTASYEYGVKGIRINSVVLGAIRTPLLAAALESMGITEADIIPTMSLIGRLGEPRAALNSYKQRDRTDGIFILVIISLYSSEYHTKPLMTNYDYSQNRPS